MNVAVLTTVTAVVVAFVTAAGTIIVQRMSGRITSQNQTIDQFQEQAQRADERATKAEKAADEARAEVSQMWATIRSLQEESSTQRSQIGGLQQQLDWSKGHIRRLTDHINDGLGPPPPPLPDGLHWPGYPGSASSANPPA